MDYAVSIISVFSLGLVHALEPGHGKSLMTLALIGSKNKWKDPIVLAISSAVAHSAGIACIALISFFLAHIITADSIRETIEIVAASLVIALGAIRITKALRGGNSKETCSNCSCTELNQAEKNHQSSQSLPIVGFLIGITPCPTAFVIAISAINLGSIYKSLFLTIIFGLGMAFMLAAIGIFLTHAQDKLVIKSCWINYINPALISAIIILTIGVLMAVHATNH